MTRQELREPLAHRDDCKCGCHQQPWLDGVFGPEQPPHGPACCYGEPGSLKGTSSLIGPHPDDV